MRLFRRKMNLWFVTSAVMRTVTAVNGDGTITVNTAVTLVDGERIVRGDAAGRTSNNKDIEGLGKAVTDTGTYLQVARAGYPEWQANVIELNGSTFDEDVIQSSFDTAEINGTEEPDTLISEHVVRRMYVALLQNQKRFANTLSLRGGYKALDYNGQPWLVDKHCPPQRLYYLRLADFTWYVMKQIGWINRDGSVLKWVDQKDAYRAVLAAYRNIACKRPANQTVLTEVI